MISSRLFSVLTCCVLVLAGCSGGKGGGPSTCRIGFEACPCYGNDTCNVGLTCIRASNVCVDLGGSGGTSGGTGGAVAGTGGATVGTGGTALGTGGGDPGSGGIGGGGAVGSGGAGTGGAGSGGAGTGGRLGTGGAGSGGAGTGGRAGTGGTGTGGTGTGGTSTGGTGTGGTGTGGMGTGGTATGGMGTGGMGTGGAGTGGAPGPCVMYCGPLSAPTITTVAYYTELTFAPICVETIAPIHGYACSQLGTRHFRINGMDRSADCDGNGRTTLPAKANGGYCLQLTPGMGDFAYFQTY